MIEIYIVCSLSILIKIMLQWPQVDWPELGTIIITALVSGVVGYFVHWLQTIQQRNWQRQEEQKTIEKLKLEEKQREILQFIRRQQLVFEHLASIGGRYEVLEMSKDDLRAEFIIIAQELAELNAQAVWLNLPEDPELIRLNKQLGEEKESLTAQVELLRDTSSIDDGNKKIIEILTEKSQAFARIGKSIDKRFEELKTQIK